MPSCRAATHLPHQLLLLILLLEAMRQRLPHLLVQSIRSAVHSLQSRGQHHRLPVRHQLQTQVIRSAIHSLLSRGQPHRLRQQLQIQAILSAIHSLQLRLQVRIVLHHHHHLLSRVPILSIHLLQVYRRHHPLRRSKVEIHLIQQLRQRCRGRAKTKLAKWREIRFKSNDHLILVIQKRMTRSKPLSLKSLRLMVLISICSIRPMICAMQLMPRR
mmetsp:Transcript_2974/g.6402  ORF Transcript_2974/g.6402 Transcript_2974/m.6402 type:complete len:215 (+) Transcript_2974:1110-1754(+)